MKVLVTGASGLIGRHAVPCLQARGFQVTPVGRQAAAQGETGLLVDLTEASAMETMVAARPDAIVHCAAAIPAAFFGEEAQQAAVLNRLMDENVLQACLRAQARLVYCSSASVYGLTGAPWREDSVLAPPGAYAEAKVETERAIAKAGLNHAIFRLSSPYGVRQRSRNVLWLFIERALQDLDLNYFGSGSRQQDFIAAADVAAAIVLAVQQPEVSGVFNIASGDAITMKQLAELVVKSVPGSRSLVRPAGREDPQEDYRAAFDLTQALVRLRWSASITLARGVAELIASRTRAYGNSSLN